MNILIARCHRIAVALATTLVAACVSQPVPLQGQFTPITPRQAADHDSNGAVVRWGGRIVGVEPGNNRTCFEMLATTLDYTGRPYWATDDVGGRFIACRTGFYDPALDASPADLDLYPAHGAVRRSSFRLPRPPARLELCPEPPQFVRRT